IYFWSAAAAVPLRKALPLRRSRNEAFLPVVIARLFGRALASCSGAATAQPDYRARGHAQDVFQGKAEHCDGAWRNCRSEYSQQRRYRGPAGGWPRLRAEDHRRASLQFKAGPDEEEDPSAVDLRQY